MKAQPTTKKAITYKIEVPQGILCEISDTGLLKVKGAKGEAERHFLHPLVTLKKEGNAVTLRARSSKKKGKRMLHSSHAHIMNLLRGVQEGFAYKLKICSGHFPMTVKQEGDKVVISNFLGEKIPRIAPIIPGAKVKIEKETIIVEAANIEVAGQTAANIESATRIKGRDRRVFQDGIYIVEKPAKIK